MAGSNTPEKTEQKGPLQINLRRILDTRMPASKRRWIPGWLIRRLERLVRQKELNGILERTYPRRGVEFATAALQDLQISIETEGLENIPADGRFVFASNHPLGGLDGIALISVLGSRFGADGIRFPVNDLLMNVEPLRDVFVPINKFGRQRRAGAQALQQAWESDRQILYFPAGLVSRLGKKGRIADLKWQKTFAAKALETGRDIIPVYFEGRNSMKFYRTARWRRRLRIGFNLEQILLPQELVKARGSRFRIIFGKPLTLEQMRASGKSPAEIAEDVRNQVYNLARQ